MSLGAFRVLVGPHDQTWQPNFQKWASDGFTPDNKSYAALLHLVWIILLRKSRTA